MMRTVKVAICGKLPTTYQFLLQQNIFDSITTKYL